MYDDEKPHNLEVFFEALKEPVCALQVHIRQLEQERDFIISWWGISMVPALAAIGAGLIPARQ